MPRRNQPNSARRQRHHKKSRARRQVLFRKGYADLKRHNRKPRPEDYQ